MEPDFSGYATKAGLKCTDGRTIMPDAFKHQDSVQVPLVWAHGHNDPDNVLGHAILENRGSEHPDGAGTYCYAFFNETPKGVSSKVLVQHKDVDSLSIYANQLVERSKQVFHGIIREVSLVLAGANEGAKIDFVRLQHGDGTEDVLEDEAVIFTGLSLQHEAMPEKKTEDKTVEHAEDGEKKSVEDVYDSMSEEQKEVLHFMVGEALESNGEAGEKKTDDAEHSGTNENKDEGDLAHKEGTEMTRNVFEQSKESAEKSGPSLTHDQLATIVADGQRLGSMKESLLSHAVEYGIENIDFLFPEARNIQNAPELIARRSEWVNEVVGGARKSPFARIKTLSADITLDTARAKGYIKGNLKKEEFFALQKRVTTPTTIYKKQKLDRDDLVDITDFDVVLWLKGEMRLMLDEEIARAVLVGDGREIDDEDKIDETHIRPIAQDDFFYAHQVEVGTAVTGDAVVEAIIRGRKFYRGAGNPTMFCTEDFLTDLLLIKIGPSGDLRRLYPTQNDLMAALRVSKIVTVDILEGATTTEGDLLAILVNMSDYTMGADKGGNIALFDDFDIDYNQYKYLIETRMSGTLTKYKSAMVVTRKRTNEAAVTPAAPTFVNGTGVITIPSTTGVVYKNAATQATLSAGAQSAIAVGATLEVEAVPATGYIFPHNFDADWSFTRTA